jgi:predicted PurR-regulated permease PerM
MKKVKVKSQVKKQAAIISVVFVVLLIIASVVGILLYQQMTILSLGKNISSMSQKIKKMNTIPTTTPTNIPTPTPTPTLIPLPTATPTPNPIIQDRINQIDEQISSMQKNIQSTLDQVNNIGPCMTTTCTMYVSSIYSGIQSSKVQIQQLQAEKTQLQIQLEK